MTVAHLGLGSRVPSLSLANLSPAGLKVGDKYGVGERPAEAQGHPPGPASRPQLLPRGSQPWAFFPARGHPATHLTWPPSSRRPPWPIRVYPVGRGCLHRPVPMFNPMDTLALLPAQLALQSAEPARSHPWGDTHLGDGTLVLKGQGWASGSSSPKEPPALGRLWLCHLGRLQGDTAQRSREQKGLGQGEGTEATPAVQGPTQCPAS